jgi:hypothetical protein
MIDAAEKVEGGIKIDKSVLQLYPSVDGMQHDQRKEGFPLLTKWIGITWPGGPRKIPDPKAPLHPSVYERFKLPAVVQYDIAAPYGLTRAWPYITKIFRSLSLETGSWPISRVSF